MRLLSILSVALGLAPTLLPAAESTPPVAQLTAGAVAPEFVTQDLAGRAVRIADYRGKVLILDFWATWCSPCKKELNTYAEYYDQWKEETGVKIYAITIDDQRTVNSVKPYVNSVAWEYDILSDVNKTFSQAMGVNSPPHTFLLNGKGEIVWQHVGYTPGDEEEVHEQLLKLTH